MSCVPMGTIKFWDHFLNLIITNFFNSKNNMSVLNNNASCLAPTKQYPDSIRITIVDPDQLDCTIIYLPKAFTPNGDGLNDFFQISNPNAIDNLLSFEIFDRWGSKVFSTNNSFEGWDGSFKNERMNPGVLLYRVRHLCKGEERVDVGSFSIIR